ncbi:hypothetical protein MRB53_039741 [Persea americana]|nr:hypothetical protein MRB53_039741 [Persea americana]
MMSKHGMKLVGGSLPSSDASWRNRPALASARLFDVAVASRSDIQISYVRYNHFHSLCSGGVLAHRTQSAGTPISSLSQHGLYISHAQTCPFSQALQAPSRPALYPSPSHRSGRNTRRCRSYRQQSALVSKPKQSLQPPSIKRISVTTNKSSTGARAQESKHAPVSHSNGKRKAPPSPARMFSSSEDEESEAEVGMLEPVAKRTKHVPPAFTRHIRDIPSEAGPPIINGTELTTGDHLKDFKPIFEEEIEAATEISLTYPCSARSEKFTLVWPREADGYNPLEDVRGTIREVLTHYLPPTQSAVQLDLSDATGDGTIPRQLDTITVPPLPLVERILSQIYARTVSPHVNSLRRYQNGSDNVYGELLPPFASQIFRDTALTPSSTFLDLGSGVGNVVLQAALEIGCEAVGIEMMHNACKLAVAQAAEFPGRTKLWGLAAGKVELLEGDFTTHPRIPELLRKADVVLVNNQAFTPDLNDKLKTLFLELKDGARVVSLKNFVPGGWKLTERTCGEVTANLDVQRKEYWRGCVSWTDQGGEYFVATKDEGRVARFLKEQSRGRRA